MTTPANVVANPGRAHITLRWTEVRGALFYEVERANKKDGRYVRMSPSQGWTPMFVQRILRYVLSGIPLYIVARSTLVDTSVRPSGTFWYRVSASDGTRFSAPSAPICATPLTGGSDHVNVYIESSRAIGTLKHRWEIMVNCEHLSYLLNGDMDARLPSVSEGLRRANKKLHDDFGIQYVRAHGVFLDDVRISRPKMGPRF